MARKAAERATAGIPESLAALAVPVADLVPYGRNPRRGAVPKIVASLKTNGQYRPIVVRAGTLEVLAGNHTLLAALELGWTHIAATFVEVDDEAAARIVLVDNKTADEAGYDSDVLTDLLASLTSLDGTGWTSDELDQLLAASLPRPALTDPDDAPDCPEPSAVVSREGDVWILGPHRLLCGSSTNVTAVEEMLDGDVCDAMWTDPPYGVSYVGGTKDKLTILNDGADDLDDLLAGFLSVASVVLRPGAPWYIAHADKGRFQLEGAVLEAGWSPRQELVWVKSSLVLSRSDYHSRHEPILAGETPLLEDEPVEPGHEPVLYGFTTGGRGRLGRGGPAWHGDNKQTTVFEVPKPPRNDVHPTMKPVALITAHLGNSVRPGGVVYEPFGGSGSTLIAAHTLGMKARLVELDPKYCDVICRRYQEHTGIVPVLRETGLEHDFTAVAS